MIYIQYEKSNETHSFVDVLVLEDDHGLSDEELEALKETRFQNWLNAISQSTIPTIAVNEIV
jgi:hypothetical protein